MEDLEAKVGKIIESAGKLAGVGLTTRRKIAGRAARLVTDLIYAERATLRAEARDAHSIIHDRDNAIAAYLGDIGRLKQRCGNLERSLAEAVERVADRDGRIAALEANPKVEYRAPVYLGSDPNVGAAPGPSESRSASLVIQNRNQAETIKRQRATIQSLRTIVEAIRTTIAGAGE